MTFSFLEKFDSCFISVCTFSKRVTRFVCFLQSNCGFYLTFHNNTSACHSLKSRLAKFTYGIRCCLRQLSLEVQHPHEFMYLVIIRQVTGECDVIMTSYRLHEDAKIGAGHCHEEEKAVIGKFGLGERNKRRQSSRFLY